MTSISRYPRVNSGLGGGGGGGGGEKGCNPGSL